MCVYVVWQNTKFIRLVISHHCVLLCNDDVITDIILDQVAGK